MIEVLFDNESKRYYSNVSILRGLLMYNKITYNSNSINMNNTEDDTNNINNDNINNINNDNFVKNMNGFDISLACNWITDNSYPYYIKGKCGKCAKFVRSAIDVGFGTNPNNNTSYTGKNGRPSWAWHYGDFLPKIGFKHLQHITRSDLNSYSPLPGDIAVYKKNGSTSQPGHICMYNGNQWVSDFKQNSVFVYQNTNEGDIFRFT